MLSFFSSLKQGLQSDKDRRRTRGARGRRFQRTLHAEKLEDRRLLAQTVGVFQNEPDAYDGYTLFSPELTHRTYLIDNAGNQVHAWPSDYDPANSGYLQPDGSIWRGASLGLSNAWPWTSAGVGGLVQQISWDGNVVAQFRLNEGTGNNPGNDSRILHHDIEPLPNGNVAMIAFDYMSRSRAEDNGLDLNRNARTTPAGEPDDHLIPDSIIEVAFDDQGRGTIVWEWHVEDHFVQDKYPSKLNYVEDVSAHPERIDINYIHPRVGAQADITHANGLEYIEELDQFILSVRSYSEIWIIDHNTVWDPAQGVNEPAGEKGDLLYRWGNPAAYQGGSIDDQQSFFQHDALWVPSDYAEIANPGSITLYNNGHWQDSNRSYSTVENFVPPIVYHPDDGSFSHYALTPDIYETGVAAWGPAVPGDDWITLAEFKTAATSPMESGDEIHFSAIISGAHRMPNGNTVITEGVTGTIFEVTPNNELVWEYVSPVVPGGTVAQGDNIPLVDFFPPALNTHDNFIFKARRYGKDYLENGLDPEPGDTAGLFDPTSSTWYLNNRSDGSIYDLIVSQGDMAQRAFLPISGDWDGDGIDTVGLYDNATNTWYLNNNTTGEWDASVVVLHGDPALGSSLQPIAGDWDGPDGNGVRVDMPGLYDWRTNTWHLYSSYDANFEMSAIPASGPNHRQQSWKPIAGDWDGDGIDSIGLYVPSMNIWYLNNENDGSIDKLDVARGPRHNRPAWRPIAGDWNLDGVDNIGLFVPGSNIWYLNNRNDGSISDLIAFQGPLVPTSWKPIAGNWNGSQAGDSDAPDPVPTAGEGEGGSSWVESNLGNGLVPIDVSATELGLAAQSLGPLDANVNGEITPEDLLTVINAVNTLSSDTNIQLDLYPDVSGDMMLSAIDALLLINHLNRQATLGLGEGESPEDPALDVVGPQMEVALAGYETQDLSPAGAIVSTGNVLSPPAASVIDWAVRKSALPFDADLPVTDRDVSLEEILDQVAEEITGIWAS